MSDGRAFDQADRDVFAHVGIALCRYSECGDLTWCLPMHVKKGTVFPGVPDVVAEHYQKKLHGFVREMTLSNCTIITTTKEWSKEDEDTMRRLLTWPHISETWHKITAMFPHEEDQILLFEAAWQVHFNYDRYRYLTTAKAGTRKDKAKLKISTIKKKSEELVILLDELSALGYCSYRNSNANLSEGIRDELSFLIEKVGNFDANYVSEYGFINAAISKQQHCPKTEYLRGFVVFLNESGLKTRASNDFAKIIASLANAALDDADDIVIDKSAWDVLKEQDKLREQRERDAKQKQESLDVLNAIALKERELDTEENFDEWTNLRLALEDVSDGLYCSNSEISEEWEILKKDFRRKFELLLKKSEK